MQPPSLWHSGGGRNGHIGLPMNAAVYTNIANTRYMRPTDPVQYAQHGQGETSAARDNNNSIQKE